jgi:hypothetical protein
MNYASGSMSLIEPHTHRQRPARTEKSWTPRTYDASLLYPYMSTATVSKYPTVTRATMQSGYRPSVEHVDQVLQKVLELRLCAKSIYEMTHSARTISLDVLVSYTSSKVHKRHMPTDSNTRDHRCQSSAQINTTAPYVTDKIETIIMLIR